MARMAETIDVFDVTNTYHCGRGKDVCEGVRIQVSDAAQPRHARQSWRVCLPDLIEVVGDKTRSGVVGMLTMSACAAI